MIQELLGKRISACEQILTNLGQAKLFLYFEDDNGVEEIDVNRLLSQESVPFELIMLDVSSHCIVDRTSPQTWCVRYRFPHDAYFTKYRARRWSDDPREADSLPRIYISSMTLKR